jgi:Tfp pilus assembly protein PilP
VKFARLSRPSVATAVLLSTVALAGCGESAEAKAKAQVCDARADISKQIDKLTALSLSTAALTEATTGVEAIGTDLKKIKDAQSDLQPGRRAQVEKATETFQKQLSSIVSGITSGLSLSNAGTHLKTATSELVASYGQTLAPISCP